MVRKPKTEKVARTRAGGEWTEAAFWGFIRGVLRQGARKWPPIVRLALERVKRPSQSSNKRLSWEYQCESCGEWKPRKEVQVDHLIPCGSLRKWDDVSKFAERLFCETEGLMVLCTECHQRKTNLERENDDVSAQA